MHSSIFRYYSRTEKVASIGTDWSIITCLVGENSVTKFYAGVIRIYSNLRERSISLVCFTRTLRLCTLIDRAPEIALAEQRLSKCGSADYRKPIRKLHRE